MATAQIETKAKRPPQTLHLKKILVPLDFSSPSKQRAAQVFQDARSTFRVGLAAHEIAEAAKELDVDLIVIATHGHTGWKHFAIGSTAERVVRAARCPVLVVREKEHDFCEMKTISYAFYRKKRSGRKTRLELVGSTKSTKKSSVTPRRHPDFPFDYNENEALVIGESLDEKERRG